MTHRRTIEAFIFPSRAVSLSPPAAFIFFRIQLSETHGVQPGGFNVSLPLADFIFSRIKNNLDHNTIHSHINCLSTRGGTARTKGRVVLHSDSAYRPATRRVPSTQPHLSMEDGTDPEGLRSNQSIGRRTNTTTSQHGRRHRPRDPTFKSIHWEKNKQRLSAHNQERRRGALL